MIVLPDPTLYYALVLNATYNNNGTAVNVT